MLLNAGTAPFAVPNIFLYFQSFRVRSDRGRLWKLIPVDFEELFGVNRGCEDGLVEDSLLLRQGIEVVLQRLCVVGDLLAVLLPVVGAEVAHVLVPAQGAAVLAEVHVGLEVMGANLVWRFEF